MRPPRVGGGLNLFGRDVFMEMARPSRFIQTIVTELVCRIRQINTAAPIPEIANTAALINSSASEVVRANNEIARILGQPLPLLET
jgi:hypothetical protein